MAKPKTIRALERGLEVMRYLQTKHPATLNDIHQATGLPRPTLLRILRTLEIGGMVRRGMGDGLYRNGYRLQRLAEQLDETDQLAEIAAPILDRLCQKVSWPSDLAVLRRVDDSKLMMEVKETSRPHSPFTVNHVRIGFNVNVPMSAVGRAYLAFCPDEEREKLLAQLAASDDPANSSVRDHKQMEQILQEVREKGYAIRNRNFVGGFPDVRPFPDDDLAAIAVPLSVGGRVHGAISLVWLRQALETDEFVTKYLADLGQAAEEICQMLTEIEC